MTANPTESRVRPASRFVSKLLQPGALFRVMAGSLLLSLTVLAVFVASAQESTPEATPSIDATPTPEMPRLELELNELNDSGIGGTVTLYDAGDETIIEFDVEDAGGDHPTHIHEGRCGELEPEPAFPLENINDDGESITVVEIALSDLLAEDYAIDMHLASNQLGTLIACVDISGEPGLPAGATPGSSPEATPSDRVDATGGRLPTEEATATEVSDGTEGALATETPVATEVAVATDVPGATEAPEITQPSAEPTTTSVTEAALPEGTAAPAGEDDTDGTGGATIAVPDVSQQQAAPGDGTAGVSGKGTPVQATTLPQRAGVGAALEWPDDPVTAVMWASLAGSVILGISAWLIRRGEQQTLNTPPRWTRMGV